MLNFAVQDHLCTRCGLCVLDCPSRIIETNGDRLPFISARERGELPAVPALLGGLADRSDFHPGAQSGRQPARVGQRLAGTGRDDSPGAQPAERAAVLRPERRAGVDRPLVGHARLRPDRHQQPPNFVDYHRRQGADGPPSPASDAGVDRRLEGWPHPATGGLSPARDLGQLAMASAEAASSSSSA